MHSQFISAYIDNAEEEAAALLPSVLAGTTTPKGCLDLCAALRIQAIGDLLASGGTTVFYRELDRSARAFLYTIEKGGVVAKISDAKNPFFDALAANDLACAIAIAKHAPREWLTSEEYEEDFLYLRFLCDWTMAYVKQQDSTSGVKRIADISRDTGMVVPPKPVGAIPDAFVPVARIADVDDALRLLLDRFEEVLDGDEDPRMNLCAALLDRDASAFDAALNAVLDDHAGRMLRLSQREVLLPEVASTEAFISIEGLALLRLAEQAGITTQPNYRCAPSTARAKAPASFDDDAWRQRPQTA